MDSTLSGIYSITNIVNGKIYIGSTVRKITTRFREHIYRLKKGVHTNTKLQNSWNKHGESNFKFEVIENTEKDLVCPVEQYWINMVRPEYNIRSVASNNYGVRYDYDTRLNMSRASGGKSFEVWKNGTLVKVFDMQSSCSSELGIAQSKISRCLKGDISQTKGYKFNYVGESSSYVKKIRTNFKRTPITEETRKKISKSNTGKVLTNASKDKISKTRKKLRASGDLIINKVNWDEKTRLKIARTKTKGTLRIFNKNGDFLEDFSSMKEMCDKYNLNSANVHHVLSGKRKTHKNYKFKRII